MDANAACIPSRAWAGHDKATLTDAQQESLAIFKRFNISQPYLRGQVILAKVLRATPKHLLVDPGYYSLNSVARQDLASAAAYNEHGEPIPRKSAVINPGEYVKVRLSAFNTPYGDAQLDPVGVPRDVRQKLVWEELEYRMQKGLSVQGRILNATAGGYAVGVAGYVALLQRQQASVQQTRKIGVLQDFYIHRMDRKRRRIELSNMQRHRESKEDLYKDTM